MIYFILGISITFNIICIVSLILVYKLKKFNILKTDNMLKDYIVNSNEMQDFFGEEI